MWELNDDIDRGEVLREVAGRSSLPSEFSNSIFPHIYIYLARGLQRRKGANVPEGSMWAAIIF